MIKVMWLVAAAASNYYPAMGPRRTHSQEIIIIIIIGKINSINSMFLLYCVINHRVNEALGLAGWLASHDD